MSKNKTGKYLKYALGEIALIITGVLIALSASNWNSRWGKRRTSSTLCIPHLSSFFWVSKIRLETNASITGIAIESILLKN